MKELENWVGSLPINIPIYHKGHFEITAFSIRSQKRKYVAIFLINQEAEAYDKVKELENRPKYWRDIKIEKKEYDFG